MKKALIGLLVLAAGAIIYFLLRNNKPNSVHPSQQELIIGKWKLDTILFTATGKNDFIASLIGMIDTNFTRYEYEFKKNGDADIMLGDSLTKGSIRFEWNKEGQLVWKEFPDDPKGEFFDVSIPHQDSLYLQSKDSAVLIFLKLVK